MSIDFSTVRRDNPLLEVISRYVELVKRGSEFAGLCPFHHDKKPSLTVYNSSDGLMRYRCFACGAGSEGGDVIDFIVALEGVTITEACKMLSSNKLPEIGTFKPPSALPDVTGDWKPIIPVPDDAPEYQPAITFNPKSGRIWKCLPSRIDPYFTRAGKIICYVIRLDYDDGEKMTPTITFCAGPNEERRWCSKRMPPPFPLHGLHDLEKHSLARVLIVSGEKCRERIAKRLKNTVVISWLGGDQSIGKIWLKPLYGRNLTFCPDADSSGRWAMLRMYNLILQGEEKINV